MFILAIRFCSCAVEMSTQKIDTEHDNNWDGAGALPYCIHDGKVYFLFQETKGGKKEGTLVDFGGGRNSTKDSSLMYCGAREFTEETAGLFTTSSLASDIEKLDLLDHHGIEESDIVLRELENCMESVIRAHSKGYMVTTSQKMDLWYASFAIQIAHSSLAEQNRFFGNLSKRKVRVFEWVHSDTLLELLRRKQGAHRLPLHERVHMLIGLEELVIKIVDQETR